MLSLLFASLTANFFKLIWQQLQRSCPRNSLMFGGQSALVTGTYRQGVLGMTGQGPIDERHCLRHNVLQGR